MTACVNGLPGNGSNKPASGLVAAKNDDAEPASFTRDGDYIIFGHYEQDGDTSNGPEPIEWEVLDEYDGGMQHGAWWLRSPGYIGCRACLAARYGGGGWGYEGLVICNYNGVRPAIYIKL